jgi:hypothetical protein
MTLTLRAVMSGSYRLSRTTGEIIADAGLPSLSFMPG